MCRFMPYKPPTAKEALDSIYRVLGYADREGMEITVLAIGPALLDAIRSHEDVYDVTASSCMVNGPYAPCKLIL